MIRGIRNCDEIGEVDFEVVGGNREKKKKKRENIVLQRLQNYIIAQ